MGLSTTIFKFRIGLNGHRQYEIEPGRWVSRQRLEQLRNREAVAARQYIQYAISVGKIQPQPCKVCGEPKTQAHHSDHSKPTEITWLCTQHHAEQPRRQRRCNRPFQPRLLRSTKYRKVKPIRESTKAREASFRAAIWLRDQGLDRATGKPLEHQTDNWDRLGDVCHLKSRGAYPELKYVTSNAFLMCRNLHIASDGRGHSRLKISGDADVELRFVMTDKHGQVLWERKS